MESSRLQEGQCCKI